MNLSTIGGTVQIRPKVFDPIKQTQKWMSIANDQCAIIAGVPATASTQMIGIVAHKDTTLIALRIPQNVSDCFGEVKDTIISEFFLVNGDS